MKKETSSTIFSEADNIITTGHIMEAAITVLATAYEAPHSVINNGDMAMYLAAMMERVHQMSESAEQIINAVRKETGAA